MGRAAPDILELVGQLHEGIADDDAWTGAISGFCSLLSLPGLLMGVINRHGTPVHFEFGHNVDNEMISLLTGPLADPAHNPWIGLAQAHPIRQAGTVADLGGQQALERTRMWTEFYRRYGLGDSLASTLERQPEYAHALIVTRLASQPDFDSNDRRAFASVLPHIARAWRVKRQLAEWQAKAGTLKLVLDRLDRAIVVTGPEGEIRFANRAADRLLSRGTGIDATRGRLRASTPRETDALRQLIDGATRTGI